MALFLAVHARYKDVQLGLYRDEQCLDLASDESKKISKNFISLLDGLLKKHRYAFSDLAFIAAHQGPAPFTTLRVCLTTVNGFAFATGIPLIGINGLQELVAHYKQQNTITVALLNAFSHEIYYGIDDPYNQISSFGCAPAELFFNQLAQKYQTPITFVGNGIELYEHLIKKTFGDRAHFLNNEIMSIELLSHKALEKWNGKHTQNQLMPLYLKEYVSSLAILS